MQEINIDYVYCTVQNSTLNFWPCSYRDVIPLRCYQLFFESPLSGFFPPFTFHLFLQMHVYTGRQCNQPMGLQSGRLKNHLVTASSQWDKYHAAFLARLHWQRRGRYMGAWSARHNNRYQWLQLDFGGWAKIIRLATQGRQDTDQWVTQYYVRHSLDGIRFVDYQERNTRKVSTQYQGSVKRLGKLWSGIGVKNTVTRCWFLLVYWLCRLADLSYPLVNLLYSLITSARDDKISRQDYVSSTQDARQD